MSELLFYRKNSRGDLPLVLVAAGAREARLANLFFSDGDRNANPLARGEVLELEGGRGFGGEVLRGRVRGAGCGWGDGGWGWVGKHKVVKKRSKMR